MIRKRLLSACLALALCLSLLPVTVLAAGEHDSHSNNWMEFTAGTTTLSGGSYYLSGDVEYSGTESITVSGEVILCLNDHKLDLKGQHISVGSGASLTLCDCSTGGVLTGGSGSNGGGVYVGGGGTFTMTGGSIAGNTAAAGGGVYVDEGGTFTMAGGSINNNKATSGGGGGVLVNLGTFTLSGGSITGNTTNSDTFGYGGGVCLYGTFYLSGDSIIQNNTKAGATDNLYLGWNTIKITGPLGENARIGVTAEGVPRSFISGWSDNMAGENPADYFSSDGDALGIGLNADGNVVLGSLCTTITLDPNGGTLPEYSLVAGAALPIPTKTGYTFAGWYDNEALSGSPATTITDTDTGDKTYYAKWLSTDAGVASVSVNGVAGIISGNQITVTLPPNSALPDGTDDITITPAAGAVSSNLTFSADTESVTYTFTVTAEDGQTTANYTVTVTVAADPAAGNKADVDAAKTAVESHTWTVPQATANTQEAVKAWIEGQLAGLTAISQNDVSYSVTMTSFTAADRGTSADRDGTNGSFAFTVVLSKGTDTGDVATSTYAETTATVTGGTITATAYTGGGGPTTYAVTAPDAENGTVRVSPSRASRGTTVTITVTPDEGYELESLTVLDSRGEEITLTDKGDGKYTFTMPASRVTVEASFAPAPLPFEDVASGAWYEGAVRYAYLHDIMEGMSATTFQPNGTLSRAMAVQIFYNLEGQPDISGENLGYPYEDVDAQAWYGNAVYWARITGVATGYGDGTFQPTDSITRQEFAQMLYNYAKYKDYDLTAEGDLSTFPDGNKVQEWAVPAMSWANGNQLINGHDDGTLEPGGTATRAQAASILTRFDQNFTSK